MQELVTCIILELCRLVTAQELQNYEFFTRLIASNLSFVFIPFFSKIDKLFWTISRIFVFGSWAF